MSERKRERSSEVTSSNKSQSFVSQRERELTPHKVNLSRPIGAALMFTLRYKNLTDEFNFKLISLHTNVPKAFTLH